MALGVGGAGPIVGRDRELGEVDAWLDALELGPAALVVEGEPGIGKTTVWRDGCRSAEGRGFRLLVSRPAETEAKLGFSSLADLLGPVEESRLEELPDPQREALEVALLRTPASGRGPQRRAVATALLSLLRVLAGERPVVLAVDDLQWLDVPSAQALEFALRRLDGERVGLLASCRVDEEPFAMEQSRRVRLGPLSVAALHRIIVEQLGHALPRPALVRVARAVLGNPFYAVEIARLLLAEGGAQIGGKLPVPGDLRLLTEQRVRALPVAARQALLRAAATARPEASQFSAGALAPSEAAGLVRVDDLGRVEFSHPLIASAVYGSATVAERRSAHRALAKVISDPEEQARHLALGAERPAESIAERLDEAAKLAAARGAIDSAAELAELALRLTPDGDGAAHVLRSIALARLLYAAGNLTAAIETLEAVRASAPPGAARSDALVDLGGLYVLAGRNVEGKALIDEALEGLEDPVAAARAHARRARVSMEELAAVIEHCRAVLELIGEDDDPALYSFALQYLACARLFAGEAAEHELIERSLRAQEGAALWDIGSIGGRWAGYFDDYATAWARYEAELARAEAHGDESERQGALFLLAGLATLVRPAAEAERLALEALALAEQIEQEPMACTARFVLGLALVHQGRLEEARALAPLSLEFIGDPPQPGAFVLATQTYSLLGFAAFAEDDFEEADRWFTRADETSSCWPEPSPFRFHPDHAETVIALGDLDRAETLVRRLEARAAAIPRRWICMVAARSRAILLAARGDLDGAVTALGEAMRQHEGLELPFERARTLLVLGRVRRRRKEKRAARDALAEAAELFASVGAPLWARKATAELDRVGLRTSSRTELTVTERNVAVLAASGLSNREVAERAFLSARTVEGVLTRVYRKLGVRSRTGLARVLDAHK
jgi:DNA-binding CsgD family transcriptional regulator